MKLWLVRHGVTAANAERRLQSSLDLPLTNRGMAEAAALAKLLKSAGITQVLSSPALRAMQTASVIAESLRVQPIISAGLRERSLGPYDGMPIPDLEARRRTLAHQFVDPTQDWEGVPEVESDGSVSARFLEVLHHPSTGGQICVVTHAGVIKSFFHSVFSIPSGREAILKARNACVLTFEFDGKFWRFEGMTCPTIGENV